jgi:hypothetical protein
MTSLDFGYATTSAGAVMDAKHLQDLPAVKADLI